MKLPFGKHKGKEIVEVPTKYLQWLVKNVELYGELEIAILTRLGLPLPRPKETDLERLDRVVRDTPDALKWMHSIELY